MHSTRDVRDGNTDMQREERCRVARSGREERRGRGEKQAFIIKYVRSCPPCV